MSVTEPPQSAKIPPLDRRLFLKGGVLGAGLMGAPLAAQSTAGGFTHGVASGEPGQDRVLLWTRFVHRQDVPLTWQLLSADGTRRLVAEGEVVASPENDFCAKAWATGLTPGTWYYYRFVSPDGSISDEGRTRTLPEGRTARWRMGVFSCSNIGFGWFNAYAAAARADDFDCAFHLGDYLYEYPLGTYPGENQIQPGRWLDPQTEIVALADYRARYANYRSDPDLRRIHQLFPMISGWDDHESTNDSWAGGAQNHQSETEGEWSVRKAAAKRAYREWMPVSDEDWATYEVGDLATLFRLETRLTARAEQFDFSKVLAGIDDPGQAQAALVAFRDGAYTDPSREILGSSQRAWLSAGMKQSRKDGKPWQVLVQQVLLGSVMTPPAFADAMPPGTPDFIRRYITQGALAARAELPRSMDAWDGYPAARARLFRDALEADANIVSLAGDTHNAWAFDLDLAGERVGVEFGGTSVTSPGIEGALGSIPPANVERAIVGTNSQLKWMDSSRRGYMVVELTPERASAEHRFVASVRDKGAGVTATTTIATGANRRMLDLS
ncbi:alkaline phosphatase D family protein [Qipengyuania sphaerica]|uniref:alkaline phosphatase D family protein n=1 Tax=Qipengyuania sphaerica TaxID=2867243 RepID=UPI001C8897F4|nr:alkaline phosphatase D family protein [Qipengyuania sphaerica]MBX7541650.1 alkaline phosphatase D family protein [Qipengyuania sphaerica]